MLQKPGSAAGAFGATPRGVILHGSRSGIAGRPLATEFGGTAQYAMSEPNGLGWNATIGSDAIAIHMDAAKWGWNARGCSKLYLAVELAQATVDDPITDGQVRALCWYVATRLRPMWPLLPLAFPTHAELDGTAEYGGTVDGKSDVYPRNDPRADELRARILARLASQYGISR